MTFRVHMLTFVQDEIDCTAHTHRERCQTRLTHCLHMHTWEGCSMNMGLQIMHQLTIKRCSQIWSWWNEYLVHQQRLSGMNQEVGKQEALSPSIPLLWENKTHIICDLPFTQFIFLQLSKNHKTSKPTKIMWQWTNSLCYRRCTKLNTETACIISYIPVFHIVVIFCDIKTHVKHNEKVLAHIPVFTG